MNVELPAVVLESHWQYTSRPCRSSADSQTKKILGIAPHSIRYPHLRDLPGAARRRDHCSSSPSLSVRNAGRGGGSPSRTAGELILHQENNIVVVPLKPWASIMVRKVREKFMNCVRAAVPGVIIVDNYYSSLGNMRVQILQADHG
jgi:hypothetical protein